jgi:hypothetical protein
MRFQELDTLTADVHANAWATLEWAWAEVARSATRRAPLSAVRKAGDDVSILPSAVLAACALAAMALRAALVVVMTRRAVRAHQAAPHEACK